MSNSIFNSKYKCLTKQVLEFDQFQIIPIRWADRYEIMKWRNDQMYHLRQSKTLTPQDQDLYFENVVSKLFEEEYPDQILFSYTENNVTIGYGGLVHISWLNRNAEISFVLNTSLENKFVEHWCVFLKLIEKIAFEYLNLYKIYTYAYDLRPALYIALDNSNFRKEATLLNHVIIENNFVDVVIHSKLKSNNYYLREANSNKDALLLFDWVNDEKVRVNSLNSDEIGLSDHLKWFQAKIRDKNCQIYILTDLFNSEIGQIRVDKIGEYYEIDYSISKEFRGKGMGAKIIKLLEEKVGKVNLLAKVKKNNWPSIKIFSNNSFMSILETEEVIVFSKKM